ncbi:hypothetical protein BJ878DRAFT_523949 [Calycina marina]|uniref:Pentatricopeptide repeat-containing protein n=1 Tax=Calycina marina TaxID=1763456 RepID=A0A9P8CBE4_9HELO|nr:hypothetical protein BJ878DRAFT_523949 [Calycina marina]
MPPPHLNLASRTRGYVCNSCLLRPQTPLRRQPPWLLRNYTSENGAPRPRNRIRAPIAPEPLNDSIRYYEQGPGGERVEVEGEDPEEAELRETVEATLRNLDETITKKGKELGISPEELEKEYGMSQVELEAGLDDFGGEMGEEDLHGGVSGGEWSQQWTTENLEAMAQESDFDGSMSETFFINQMTEDDRTEYYQQERMTDRLLAQMEKYDNTDSLTEEEKEILQRELMAGIDGNLADDDGLDEIPPPTSVLPASRATTTTSNRTQTFEAADQPATVNNELVTGVSSNQEGFLDPDNFPEDYRKRVLGLDRALQRASTLLEENKLGENTQKATWQCYRLCGDGLFQRPENISMDVWSLLWDIFEKPMPKNYQRMEHIFKLGSDMRKVGVPFQPRQHMLFMEARFVEGDETGAIREWENTKETLGRDHLTFKRYWILGIRMFGEKGDAKKALDAVSQFLDRSSNAEDYRILLPVIRAYLTIDTKAGLRTAWAAYEKFKDNLGPLMRMEDYDAVIALFLAANKVPQALQVFTDMMFAGERYQERLKLGTDAIETQKEIKDLATIGTTLENSRAFAQLPANLNNKFFFGKWLKKLIGDGNLPGAMQVFELMRERGIRADAKPMNGLIGALYRSNVRSDHALGHEFAWQMIAARLEFVRQRESAYKVPKGMQTKECDVKPSYKSIQLMPVATIETFSILLEQYRRSNRKDDIMRLYTALKDAKVLPNTYFMNQMILSNWRSHDTKWTWDTYKILVSQNVQPDWDTYNYLWGIMKKATDPMTKDEFEFTAGRELFREMVSRAASLSKLQSMPRELYDAVILGLSLANDQAGTAVALRALQRHFGLWPTEETARSIVLQLTRAGYKIANREPGGGRPRPGRWGHRPKQLKLTARQTKERIHEVTKLFAAFKQQRMDSLSENGLVYDELSDDAKAEEALLLLSDLLHHVHQARLEANVDTDWRQPKSAIIKSQEAAKMMGVPDCDTWEEPR